MHRNLLGVCGFLLFGTFGMLSGVAQAHHDEQGAPTETIILQGDGLQRQEMSDEEKERRREECATAYLACVDWCKSSNPRQSGGSRQVRPRVFDKNTECMKKIESNPPRRRDY
jgi:hypothetical protein